MKVAFATHDGQTINAHFGQCASFAVYDITEEKYELLGWREIEATKNQEAHSHMDARIARIEDCPLLFVTQIGPGAAAKVTSKRIMPVKVEHETPITSQLERLLSMLQTKPPIWLAKILRQSK